MVVALVIRANVRIEVGIWGFSWGVDWEVGNVLGGNVSIYVIFIEIKGKVVINLVSMSGARWKGSKFSVEFVYYFLFNFRLIWELG